MKVVESRWLTTRGIAAASLGLAVATSCALDDQGGANQSDVGGVSTFGTGGVGAVGATLTAGSAPEGGGVSMGGAVASGGSTGGDRASGGSGTGGDSPGGFTTGGGTWLGGAGGFAAGGVVTGGISPGGTGGLVADTGGVPTGGITTGGMETGGIATGGIATGGVPACADDEIRCGVGAASECVQLGTQQNCAGCGLACVETETCAEAADGGFACECLVGQHCPAEGGSCVDVMSDSTHCGDCDVVCGLHAGCEEGDCVCADPDFPDEHLGDCFDYATDEANCGAWDAPCLPGEECVAGECTCDAPLTLCPDEAEPVECVDLARDTDNCGACGEGCALNGLCQDGLCVCQPDATLCNATEEDPGACAYIDQDPQYCGETCLDCGVEVGIGAVCTEGICECPAGHVLCIDAGSGDDICADLQTDENHCGRCGLACSSVGECVEGTCIEHPCQDLCDDPIRMDPTGTVKPVGCYELFAEDIPDATIPRLTGWEFKAGFALAVNDEPWPAFTQGGDHPLGAPRAGGWCVEVLSGSANVYAPND